jgi:hypothetical protein
MGLLDTLGGLTPEQNQGLLSFGNAMLQASGPQRSPVSFMQALGGGLDSAQQTMLAIRARQLQEQEARQALAMRSLQMQGMQGELADKEQARRQSDAILSAARQAYQTPEQQAASLPGGPTNENAAMIPQMKGGLNQDMFLAQVAQINPLKALELKASLAKQQPKVKDWQAVNVGGKVMYAPYFEDGTAGRPVPLEMARKLEARNTGGTTDLFDPYTGVVKSSVKNTYSPTDVVTMRGQDLSDARARELNAITLQGQQTQVVNDPNQGILLVNKGTGQVRQGIAQNGQPVPSENAAKRATNAKNLLPVLDQAEKLIDQSTGSYVGRGVDLAARTVGYSTAGDKANAQLRVLQAQIMMNQPRMEGPQSDKDVAMYREAAGQIGDPTVPAQIKKAAMGTIREINNRYAGVTPYQHPEDITALLNKYGGL